MLPEGDAAQVMLAQRAPVHLTLRLAARLAMVSSHGGLVLSPVWLGLVGLFVVLDIVTWRILRNSNRFFLLPRVCLGAVELAIWSAAPTKFPTYDPAVFLGVPLAAEAGVRLGPRGFAVPAINFGVLIFSRQLGGRPLLPATIGWQFLAVLCGWVVIVYERSLLRQVAAERALVLPAKELRAHAAGQNSVAMGADSVIDKIQAIAPLLGPPEPGSALNTLLDSWKATLAQSTRAKYSYLADVFNSWARRYNLHPDLHSHVEFDVEEGSGTALLTSRQSQLVGLILEQLAPSGITRVYVVDSPPVPQPPGGEVSLRIAQTTVVLPAEPIPYIRPYDWAPLTMLLGAIWTGIGLMTASVPAIPSLTILAICIASAGYAHVRVTSAGRRARLGILAVAAMVSAIQLVVVLKFLRRPVSPTGDKVLPISWVLSGTAILAGNYWADLERNVRLLLLALAAALSSICYFFVPSQPGLAELFLALMWPLVCFVPAFRLTQAMDASTLAFGERLEAAEAASEQRAFELGAASVIALAQAARDDAMRQLSNAAESLPEDLRNIATRKLEDVDQCLIELTVNDESLSLMTTA